MAIWAFNWPVNLIRGSLKNAAKRSRQHARIQQKDTHEGGTHPQCNPTNGHTYFHRGVGRTHNVTQGTDTNLFLDTQPNKTNGQSHILRQHPS